MPGTLTPTQVFTHDANVVKGWRASSNLDKSATIEDQVTGIKRGMAMYLSANGRWNRGIAPNVMTVFALQSQGDFDTDGDVGNIQTNVLSGLVAVGAYELETSEYVSDTYDPNDLLTAHAAAGDDQGKLEAGTAYADQICGVVSDGVSTNSNGISVLRFWPVWLPPSA